MLSISFLHYSIEMFCHSFLIVSHSISSLENILADNFRYIILQIFSVEFKSGLGSSQNITCNEFSENHFFLFFNKFSSLRCVMLKKMIFAQFTKENSLSVVSCSSFSRILTYSLALICLLH